MSKESRLANRDKRLAAQERVDAEKRANAHLPAATSADEPATRLVFSKYFFIVDSENGYEIYRAADILTTIGGNGEGLETPAPVHVCELASDAAVLVGVLDRYVDAVEGEDAVSIELPVVTAQPSVTVSVPDSTPEPQSTIVS